MTLLRWALAGQSCSSFYAGENLAILKNCVGRGGRSGLRLHGRYKIGGQRIGDIPFQQLTLARSRWMGVQHEDAYILRPAGAN